MLAAGALLLATPSRCDYESEYFCAQVTVDDERASGRNLLLDHRRHAYVDLDDPTHLGLRYVRLFADVAASRPDGAQSVVHIGGGGFSFPRYLQAVNPGSAHTVLEIDPTLVDIAEIELGLTSADALDIRIGDARLTLAELPTNSADLVVGDAFGSEAVPWHLTTTEFVAEVDRIMTADGVYVVNVIDGDDSQFARAKLATLAATFEHLRRFCRTKACHAGGR